MDGGSSARVTGTANAKEEGETPGQAVGWHLVWPDSRSNQRA
jgi:hypothetical protein